MTIHEIDIVFGIQVSWIKISRFFSGHLNFDRDEEIEIMGELFRFCDESWSEQLLKYIDEICLFKSKLKPIWPGSSLKKLKAYCFQHDNSDSDEQDLVVGVRIGSVLSKNRSTLNCMPVSEIVKSQGIAKHHLDCFCNQVRHINYCATSVLLPTIPVNDVARIISAYFLPTTAFSRLTNYIQSQTIEMYFMQDDCSCCS